MEDCDTYLSLPMVGGKSKVNTFKGLHERITKKVMGWKEKFISKAGREILIKTFAQAIPTYTMGIFKIPKALCDILNSTLAKYWWGQTKDEKKIHRINWKKLCSPKEEEVCVLGISKLLTWLCLQSKHGDSFTTLIHYFSECTSQGIFQTVLLWMLNWGGTHHMHGGVHWQPGR